MDDDCGTAFYALIQSKERYRTQIFLLHILSTAFNYSFPIRSHFRIICNRFVHENVYERVIKDISLIGRRRLFAIEYRCGNVCASISWVSEYHCSNSRDATEANYRASGIQLGTNVSLHLLSNKLPMFHSPRLLGRVLEVFCAQPG